MVPLQLRTACCCRGGRAYRLLAAVVEAERAGGLTQKDGLGVAPDISPNLHRCGVPPAGSAVSIAQVVGRLVVLPHELAAWAAGTSSVWLRREDLARGQVDPEPHVAHHEVAD